jgi:hypothetical protein
METRFNSHLLACAFIVAASAGLAAQQANSSNPYEGTSSPPPDDTIITSNPSAPATPPVPVPVAKPSPAHAAYSQPAPAQDQYQQPQQPPQVRSALSAPEDGTDNGIVEIAPDPPAQSGQPALNRRSLADDPDGDIVHPAPLAPGEVGEGTTIRVRLLNRLSTAETRDGDSFRTRVASDVLQDGKVLIPAGAEIDGKVRDVSTGSFGGHGSMRLNPETVILADGSRYRLYAQVSGTPGSGTRVGSEGAIDPGSHVKRDSIEYGGAVGAGAVTGAVIAGPVGALTGSIVGAGLITVHLLVNHPQAHLEEGTVLLFTLTEPLHLEPAGASGS